MECHKLGDAESEKNTESMKESEDLGQSLEVLGVVLMTEVS